MALITCNKCGKEISDKSIKCIHCGSTINIKKRSFNIKRRSLKVILKVILIFVSVLIFPLTSFVGIRYGIGLLYTIIFSIILWLIIIFPIFVRINKRK